jgi:hypothetical protein
MNQLTTSQEQQAASIAYVGQFGPGCDGQPLPSVRSGYMLSVADLHFNFDTKIENPIRPGEVGC